MFEKLDLDSINWLDVLPQYGIGSEFLSYKEGPCPICGGASRFRYKGVLASGRMGKTNGSWFCNGCRGGDGVSLISKVNGWSISETIRNLRKDDPTLVKRGVKQVPVKSVPVVDPKLIAGLQDKWKNSSDVTDSPTWAYLSRRVPGLRLSWLSKNIRHASLWYQDDDGKLRGKHPCMLAKAVDVDGKPITLHRTYLTDDGFKASALGTVKKQMAGSRVLNGDAIRLNVPNIPNDTLVVCEGIETGFALVAMMGSQFEVWSLLNAGNLAKAQVPKRFTRVVIAADRDPLDQKNGYRPGEHYASKLAVRLRAEGFHVVIRVPLIEGMDYADMWVQKQKLRQVA